MEKKDLRERLVDIMHYDGTYSTSDLVKFIQQELDKAREEGRKYALKEVEYTLAKDERYEFLFTEIKDILSKLTTK